MQNAVNSGINFKWDKKWIKMDELSTDWCKVFEPSTAIDREFLSVFCSKMRLHKLCGVQSSNWKLCSKDRDPKYVAKSWDHSFVPKCLK